MKFFVFWKKKSLILQHTWRVYSAVYLSGNAVCPVVLSGLFFYGKVFVHFLLQQRERERERERREREKRQADKAFMYRLLGAPLSPHEGFCDIYFCMLLFYCGFGLRVEKNPFFPSKKESRTNEENWDACWPTVLLEGLEKKENFVGCGDRYSVSFKLWTEKPLKFWSPLRASRCLIILFWRGRAEGDELGGRSWVLQFYSALFVHTHTEAPSPSLRGN